MSEESRVPWREQVLGGPFGHPHPSAKTPSILYHYTPLAGLIGIIQSNQIWASDLRYLNDITEAKRIWSFMERRVEHLRSSGKTFSKLNLEVVAALLRNVSPKATFVASFSEARDSLGQWRAYAGSGGVCIGFKEGALRNNWISNTKGGRPHRAFMRRYKVTYVPDDNNNCLDAEVERLLLTGGPLRSVSRVFKSTREETVVQSLLSLSTSFKHSAFADEQEWRLCFERDQLAARNQRFRLGKSTLIPYIAADLNRGIEEANESYLAEVIVGPSANMELTKTAVQQLLLVEGHEDAKVYLSEVPYRDW